MNGDNERNDDIDRLFARLQPLTPPSNMVETALKEAQERQVRRRLWLVLPGYIGLLLAVVALSFALGRTLATTGAGDLVSLAMTDPTTFASAPIDFVLAIAESVSWGLMAALLLVIVALGWCTRSVAAAGGAG